MDLDYTPGGRWVRIVATDGSAAWPVGRWHFASEDLDPAGEPASSHSTEGPPLACDRELRASLVAGGELLFIANLPAGNLCPICHRAWHSEQPRSRR